MQFRRVIYFRAWMQLPFCHHHHPHRTGALPPERLYFQGPVPSGPGAGGAPGRVGLLRHLLQHGLYGLPHYSGPAG